MEQDRLKIFLQRLHQFFEERDWKQFHSPKNIVMGVASETGELVQIFRFLTEAESSQLDPKTAQLVKDEIADVFIFLSYLADILGMDVIEAAHAKLDKNGKKYPAELCRGRKEKSPTTAE